MYMAFAALMQASSMEISTRRKCSEYLQEAILQLKERDGSSFPAIKKVIDSKHGKNLHNGWDKTLAQVLKRLVVSGKVGFRYYLQ